MIAIIFTFLLFLLKVQCAKSPKKQSVEVYFLYTDGTELTKTYSIRLFLVVSPTGSTHNHFSMILKDSQF